MSNRVLASVLFLLALVTSSNASSRFMMAQPSSPSPSPAPSPRIQKSKILPPPVKEKKQDKSGVGPGPTISEGVKKEEEEICDGSSLATCHGGQSMIGCIRHPKTDSKGFILVVQNNGENNLSVAIKVLTSPEIAAQVVKLPKHGTKKINVSRDATNNLKIVLQSGKEECQLEIASPISPWNTFQPYSVHLTPTNGIYFLIATIIIIAGTWACCKFCRKGRRVDTGVPYQQLEMGVQQTQESSSPVVEADGWDQGWDDDWDGEEGTVKPSTSSNGNVSSNGLTSRSPSKKNDWDVDWDD